MDKQQRSLWAKIKNFELDDPDAVFSFTDRLARENGWRIEYTLRAIDEYKKFLFLLCIAEHPLTPSDQVDQVWHLHLLYTESYWIDLCQRTIGKPIHHGPTRGGKQEKDKFQNWYEATLALYRSVFQSNPSPDLWPDSTSRFGDIHFQRINVKRHWIIKKPRIFQ